MTLEHRLPPPLKPGRVRFLVEGQLDDVLDFADQISAVFRVVYEGATTDSKKNPGQTIQRIELELRSEDRS